MRSGEVGRSLVAFLLSFAMVLSIVFVIVGAQRTKAAGSDPPTQIHLTWNENEDNTTRTIVVTWETDNASSGDNVLYDTQSRGGNENNYTYSAAGSHHTYNGAGNFAGGWIHDVELTELSPNTVYYFICGGDNGGWSAERSFRTADNKRTSFRFVAGGDSRSENSSFPGPRDSVSRAMAKFNPSFVLFVGDFVRYADNDREWDNWFRAVQMYWVDNDNLTIPIIPCIGNHELNGYESGGGGGISYFGQFSLPGNEEWYSLNWGPNLHIIVLDDETTISGDQTNWLQQDLAAHANYMWKIVLFHEPVYRDDGIKNYDEANYWAPLFDQYHVDLVFSGHTHIYERTYPIRGNVVQSSPENGTVYIVSGGWGAPLYSASSGKYTAYGPYISYNFVTIDILDNGTHQTLRLQAVDNYDNVFDNLTIDKICKPIVSISPSENHAENGQTVTFTVTVTNTENVSDNYNLKVSDNAVPSWGPSLSENSLTIPPNGDRTVILSVPVPPDAIGGTSDFVTVTATLQTDNTVSGSGSCIAQASIVRGVQVTISPSPQQGLIDDNLVYTIVVKNSGLVADNYKLTLSENLGWPHGWNAPSQVTLYQTSSLNFYPTDDSMVQEGVPDNNYGTRYNMYVGWVENVYKTEWSYLKFNLSSIPSGAIINSAALNLNTQYGPSHPPSFTIDNMWIEAWNVDNDAWNESTLTWNHKPAMGTTLLDNVYVIAENWAGGQNKWYSWNNESMTSFVASQYGGDKVVSIGMRSTTSESRQDNNTVWFYTKDNDWHGGGPYKPYLQVTYAENMGILENSVSLGPGENWTGQLWVVVNVLGFATDNLTVTATSLIDNTITNSAIGQAQSVVAPFAVWVSISPSENHAENGKTATFTVTVKNMGVNTDNYDLSVIDNSGWGLTLDNNRFENVLFGENKTTTLRVAIPDNAPPGKTDNITVTATSQGDPEVGKNASCIARSWNAFSHDLVAGWNLVSFPVASENDTPDNILDGQTYYMWRWSAENKKYVSPSSTAPVELGVGYWIWVGYDQTVTTSGVPVENYSINLKNGWNLVGFPVTNENTTPDNLFPGQTYYMWRWDAVNKKYVSPSSTAPVELGVGYWIWVGYDQTVTVPL